MSFDSSILRNRALIESQCPPPKVKKTGTTIVGVVYKDGVIIGADSRATSGPCVADKHCIKYHRIHDKIYACGAGTAADLDQVTKVIAGNMTLLELKTGESPYVINAVTRAKRDLFKYMGYVGAYLIIGGVDFDGVHLFNVHADGSTLQHSFVADGSGSLAAISVLEKEFKLDMSVRSLYAFPNEEQEAEALVGKALMAGMESDLNSGNSYSYVAISKDRVFMNTDITPEFCRPQPQAIQFDLKPNTRVDSFVKVVDFVNDDHVFVEDEAKKMEVCVKMAYGHEWLVKQ